MTMTETTKRREVVGDVHLDWEKFAATPKGGELTHIGKRNLVLLKFFLSKPNVPHSFATIGKELRDNGFAIKDTSVVSTMTYFRPALRWLKMIDQFESAVGFGFRFNIATANDDEAPEKQPESEEEQEEPLDERGWNEERLFFAEQQDDAGWSAALIANALGRGMTTAEVKAKLEENRHVSPPKPKASPENSSCVWLERSGFLCGAETTSGQFFCPDHMGTAE